MTQMNDTGYYIEYGSVRYKVYDGILFTFPTSPADLTILETFPTPSATVDTLTQAWAIRATQILNGTATITLPPKVELPLIPCTIDIKDIPPLPTLKPVPTLGYPTLVPVRNLIFL